MSRFTEVDVEIIRVTEHAYLITSNGKECWVGKAQIKPDNNYNEGDKVTVSIPEVFVVNYGLV